MKSILLIIVLTNILSAETNNKLVKYSDKKSFFNFTENILKVHNSNSPSWTSAGYYKLDWTYYDELKEGQDCEVGKLNGIVYQFVGQGLNRAELQVFINDANDTPSWVYPPRSVREYIDTRISAAWNTDVFAGIIYFFNFLYKFSNISSNSPDWIYDIGYGNLILDLDINREGTYISVLCIINDETALLIFKPNSNEPHFRLSPLFKSRYYNFWGISKDSNYVMLCCGRQIYVWNLIDGVMRTPINSNIPLTGEGAISGNGDYIVAGCEDPKNEKYYCYKWNGSQYSILWSTSKAYNFRKWSFNSDGSRLFAQSYDGTTNKRMFYFFDTSSSTPKWSYQIAAGGSYQNAPSSLMSDLKGNYVITGGWGSSTDISEVAILDIENRELCFSLDSPGSIFQVSISPDANYAVATGRREHANISSHGGYTYGISSLNLALKNYSSFSCIPVVLIKISPNPFSSRLSISLPSSGAIYSLTGQLIMNLDKGKHSLDTSKWKQGVYIVKSGKETKRIVKID